MCCAGSDRLPCLILLLLPLIGSAGCQLGDPRLQQASKLIEQGDYDEALPKLDRLLDKDPQNAAAHFYRGLVLEHRGERQAAIDEYTAALGAQQKLSHARREGALQRTDAELGLELGRVYYHRGMLKAQEAPELPAIEDLTEAIRLAPNNVRYFLDRGRLQLRRQLPGLALIDFEEAVRLAPSDAEAYALRGEAQLGLGEPGRAIDDCRQAIWLAPRSARAYYVTSAAFRRLPDPNPEAAERYVTMAKRIDPDIRETLEREGSPAVLPYGDPPGRTRYVAKPLSSPTLDEKLPATNGDDAEARKDDVAREVAQSPNYRHAMELGQVAYEARDWPEAIAQFTAAQRAQPRMAAAFIARGRVNMAREFYEDAVGDFNQALQRDANSAQALCLRGQAYAQLMSYPQAIRDLSEAIRLEPTLAAAYLWRGHCYAMQDQAEASQKDLCEAKRLGVQR